jgi:hypothetical protein
MKDKIKLALGLVDSSGLAAGIYVVRLEAAGATEERRIAIFNSRVARPPRGG